MNKLQEKEEKDAMQKADEVHQHAYMNMITSMIGY